MYNAIIAKIQNILPHDNANRLEICIVCNTPVIVSKDMYIAGQLVVYFGSDGQLSREFGAANDLIPLYTEIDGVKTKTNGSFFDDNLRVKPINLRGKKSDGFMLPLSCLEFTGVVVKEGDEFDSLGGIPICNKYITRATREARTGSRSKLKRLDTMTTTFHEHIDTKNFLRELQRINLGNRIIISEKIHGTSGRTSYAYTVRTKRNPFVAGLLHRCNITTTNKTIQQLWNTFTAAVDKWFTVETKGYELLCGTRRVVLNATSNAVGFYGSDEFRWGLHNKFAAYLHKGEEVFYEVVGYTTTGGAIQPSHNPAKVSKDFAKKHGAEINYSYGCLPSTCAMYVYRICMTNEDGVQLDYTWDQVVGRCAELGLQTVPVLLNEEAPCETHEKLLELVEHCSQLDSRIAGQVFSEGVAIRVESGLNVEYLKLKSDAFKYMESYSKDTGEVDMEEAQDEYIAEP